MDKPKKEKRLKVYRVVDKYGMIFTYLPCPRKLRGTRGHNPDNKYAFWRKPMREARRKIGWLTGRQWRKFRKFAGLAYRQHVKTQTDRGMNANPNTA